MLNGGTLNVGLNANQDLRASIVGGSSGDGTARIGIGIGIAVLEPTGLALLAAAGLLARRRRRPC